MAAKLRNFHTHTAIAIYLDRVANEKLFRSANYILREIMYFFFNQILCFSVSIFLYFSMIFVRVTTFLGGPFCNAPSNTASKRVSNHCTDGTDSFCFQCLLNCHRIRHRGIHWIPPLVKLHYFQNTLLFLVWYLIHDLTCCFWMHHKIDITLGSNGTNVTTQWLMNEHIVAHNNFWDTSIIWNGFVTN